jgi:hypothetical protein
MGEKCRFDDYVAQSVCEFVEKTPIEVDTGITRTDFSDPDHPVQRFIDPYGEILNGQNGKYIEQKSDGIKTSQEYYQAAIRLAEMTTQRMKVADLQRISLHSSKGKVAANLFDALKRAGVRVYWLPTDPILHEEPESPDAKRLMLSYIDKADKIWEGTQSIKNKTRRKLEFAKRLYNKMSPSNKDEEGFGINFFDPKKTPLNKKDHHFYSLNLDCFGIWLYGVLCERYGIKATPVQRFTNNQGETIDHVLVGINLNPKKPEKLTLVSFHPGEEGFDIRFGEESKTAPISRLELLALLHLTRAFTLFKDDREKQLRELEQACRYAPHYYAVHYQLGVWYWQGWSQNKNKELLDKSKYHFREAYRLNPTHQLIRDAVKQMSNVS